jgi:hypothetical protein
MDVACCWLRRSDLVLTDRRMRRQIRFVSELSRWATHLQQRDDSIGKSGEDEIRAACPGESRRSAQRSGYKKVQEVHRRTSCEASRLKVTFEAFNDVDRAGLEPCKRRWHVDATATGGSVQPERSDDETRVVMVSVRHRFSRCVRAA